MAVNVQRVLTIVPLLISMAVHFVLVSFYLLSSGWQPALVFSHTILFLVGLWALLDKDSVESVISYIVVVTFTIILDIAQLGLFFSDAQNLNEFRGGTAYRTWQFSAACVIINLIFKPVSIALASFVLYVRAGGKLKYSGDSNQNTVHGTSEDSGPEYTGVTSNNDLP